jgi:hypothetical protein
MSLSAISLSENNWDGSICIPENISNPDGENNAAIDG